MPLVPRLSTAQAEQVVLRLKEILILREPTQAIYRTALKRAAEGEIRSGGVFDALHLISAERAGAEIFLTFNLGDFARLSRSESPRVASPPDPPSLRL